MVPSEVFIVPVSRCPEEAVTWVKKNIGGSKEQLQKLYFAGLVSIRKRLSANQPVPDVDPGKFMIFAAEDFESIHVYWDTGTRLYKTWMALSDSSLDKQ